MESTQGISASSTPAAPASNAPVTENTANGVKGKTADESTTSKPFRTSKLNVNGKIIEKTWNTVEDMERDAQKAFGIEEKAQKNAAKVQAADELVRLLQSKTPGDYKKFVKICKANGIDPIAFSTDIIYDHLEYDKLTPEQKKLRDYEEREAETKAQEEEAKQAELTAKQQREIAEFQQKFEAECGEALKSGNIPTSRLSLALIAQYKDASLAAGQDIPVSQLLPFVQRDIQQLNQQTIQKLEGKALLDYLGPEIIMKITKAKVSDYKDTDLKPKQTTSPSKPKGNDKFNWKRTMNSKRLSW